MSVPKADAETIRRQWRLRRDDERLLLAHLLPRFDLPTDQLERIVSDQRAQNGLDLKLTEIAENPYTLCERYVGDNPDDLIPFGRIDHGVFPSPDLGGNFLSAIDNSRRLRALCVDRTQI